MEDLKVRSCRCCLNIIEDENYEVIENVTKQIFGNRVLKLNCDDDNECVSCNICSRKLNAALKFKSNCLDTVDAITPYIDNTTLLPIDLKEVYMRERENKYVADDIKICCLCMQPVKDISEFKSVKKEEADMIQKFIPEMNIFKIKEPVTCNVCCDSLVMHYNLLKKHSDVQGNIGNTYNWRIPDIPSPVPSLHTSVKIEDVDVKFEDVQELNETKSFRIQTVDIDVPRLTSAFRCSTVEDENLEEEICSQGKKFTKLQLYRCENCDYESNRKGNLKQHKLIHKTSSELQMYKCETCNYETKNKGDLKRHMLIHKDPSELRMYKCDACNYETKHKTLLKRHMLIHKDTSEVPIYKCKTCNHYETKHRGCLKRHMLIHKDPTEVPMYKCEHCDYKTKIVGSIKRHTLIHKNPSELQIYKCETCNHETKDKGCLRRHMIIHKDPSEVLMYKCETCNYRTKNKSYLREHILIHKDPSEVQTYKCENCNHVTRDKRNLKKHMLIHKDPSEIQMYKCYTCGYETKHKTCLKRHALTHKS